VQNTQLAMAQAGRLDPAHDRTMDSSRALIDGLLTIVLVMLLLSAFSSGTVTVPMQNGAAYAATVDADEASPSWHEITARIAELFSSL